MSIKRDDANHRLNALATEAINLEAQLPTAKSSADVQTVIGKLNDVLSRIPLGLTGTGAVQGVVRAALALAEKRKFEEQAEEETVLSMLMKQVASSMFCTSVSKHMTEDENRFFHDFKPGQKYDAYEWKDGKYVQALNADGSYKVKDGIELKEAFADIKYHAKLPSLSDEEKKEIGTPPAGESGSAQMAHLKKSLTAMEEYKGAELAKRNAGEAECRLCHSRFEDARTQADAVAKRHEKIADLRKKGEDSTLESALLSGEQKKLSTILQDDIINETLVPSQSRGAQGLQAVNVSRKELLSPTPVGGVRGAAKDLTP